MDVLVLLDAVAGATVLAGATVVVAADRRVGLGSFLAQYVGVAALLYAAGFPAAALTRLGVAASAAAILWLTLVRIGWGPRPTQETPLPAGRWFRLSAALLVAVGAWGLSESIAAVFPGLTIAHARVGAMLFGFGLLHLGLTEDPIRWIFALVTCLLGFEIVYAVLEPSLAVQSILASVHLGILVVGADIAVRREAAGEAPPNP